jgi:hypothetical protein
MKKESVKITPAKEVFEEVKHEIEVRKLGDIRVTTQAQRLWADRIKPINN